jgi:hypothetical protein
MFNSIDTLPLSFAVFIEEFVKILTSTVLDIFVFLPTISLHKTIHELSSGHVLDVKKPTRT